jgi:hypothetical protein
MRFIFTFLGMLIALALLLPPFPQDPNYHHFAAEKNILGIPNFWNVLSNLPFLAVAIAGWMRPNKTRGAMAEVFRLGVFLTAFGSAYYHWLPTNERLFWDRLPMTIAFSGVIAALISRRVDSKWGARILWPLTLLNASTVFYWRWSESNGHGNLTPYGVVQFGTVALLLGILLLSRRADKSQRFLWLALVAYIGAKLFESFDRQIAEVLGVMGGHPIKHCAAALGCWWLHRALFEKVETVND